MTIERYEPRWKNFDGSEKFRSIDKPVQELWQYVSLIEQQSHHSIPGFLRRPILFRGQPNNWPLLPKIARNSNRYLKRNEEAGLEELKRLSPLLINSEHRPSTDLEWLSLAQHYGMATRLLDWTDNALAALWFAINEIKPSDKVSKPLIWVLTPNQDDFVDIQKDYDRLLSVTKTRVVRPPHLHERVRVQSGWFTLHHSVNDKFIPLEEQSEYLSKNENDSGKLGRIEIDHRWTPRLLKGLDDCGISSASIFPDLGGLCQRITKLMESQ